MHKIFKYTLIVVLIIIVLIILDSAQALLFDNSPIIKVREYYDETYLRYKDKGFLVDTYVNKNSEKDSVIKGFSYSFATNDHDFTIIDETLSKKDFVCAEALESFYEDGNYNYYYSCIKSKYVIVKYASGLEETVKEALRKGKIVISDLDKFDIKYIKMKKD